MQKQTIDMSKSSWPRLLWRVDQLLNPSVEEGGEDCLHMYKDWNELTSTNIDTASKLSNSGWDHQTKASPAPLERRTDHLAGVRVGLDPKSPPFRGVAYARRRRI